LIEPYLQQSATKFGDQLKVVKYDVEAKNCLGIKMEFLLQNVLPQALPHLILFDHMGTPLATHTGVINQDDLNDFLQTNLKHMAKQPAPERELVGAGSFNTTSSSSGRGFISFGAAY